MRNDDSAIAAIEKAKEHRLLLKQVSPSARKLYREIVSMSFRGKDGGGELDRGLLQSSFQFHGPKRAFTALGELVESGLLDCDVWLQAELPSGVLDRDPWTPDWGAKDGEVERD